MNPSPQVASSVRPACSSTNNLTDKEKRNTSERNPSESSIASSASAENTLYRQGKGKPRDKEKSKVSIPPPVGAFQPPASSSAGSTNSENVNTRPGRSTEQRIDTSIKESNETNGERTDRDNRGNGIFNRIMQRLTSRK